MSEFLEVELQVLSTAQGGRKGPIYARPSGGANYLPHFRVGPSGEYLGVAFVDGPDLVQPGEKAIATVALIYDVDYGPLQPGTAFEVLEGLKRVATGSVLRRWRTDEHRHNIGLTSA